MHPLPKVGQVPSKTTVLQAVVLWDIQRLQEISDKCPETANNEWQGERSKQTSTVPSEETAAVARHLVEIRSCNQVGCGGAVLTSRIQSKGFCPAPCGDALTAASHMVTPVIGGQKPEPAAGGQCPELGVKQDKLLHHCLPSTGQIGKNLVEAMRRKL